MQSAVLRNIAWLFGDSFVTKLIAFPVTAFIAVYLGSTNFGYWAYALSIAALFNSFSHLGIQGLLQRELVSKEHDEAETLGTVLGLKLVATLLVAIFLIAFGLLNPAHVHVEKKLFVIMAIALLCQMPAGVLTAWFHAKTASKRAVLAGQVGMLTSAIGKVTMALVFGSLLAIGLAHATGIIVATILLCLFFLVDGGPKLTKWRFTRARAASLLKESWMLFLGGIFTTIYFKIDLVMLRSISGPSETGIYALAAMFTEASLFIPSAIAISLFPRLIRSNEASNENFDKHMQEMYDILAISSLVVLIMIFIFGPILLTYIFHNEYRGSLPIMFVHALSLPFIFLLAGFSRWILIKKMSQFSLITQGVGAMVNVGLNLILIPRFGGMGAAIATLVSYASASYLSLLLSQCTISNFYMMSRSLFQPWRATGTITNFLKTQFK